MTGLFVVIQFVVRLHYSFYPIGLIMRHAYSLYTWLKPLGYLLSVTFLSSTVALAQETPLLEAFPAAPDGYSRHVIHLPIGNYENNLKIELLPGKVQEVDCNTSHFTGVFEEKILEGWGYNYYELSELDGPVQTRMACPDDKKALQFIPVHSNGSLLQYNSSLPVVVYLPEGLELRWRTWVATPYNTAPIE